MRLLRKKPADIRKSSNSVINGKDVSLTVGDTIIIEAGEPYYWEGNMQLLLSCRPAWTMAQHQQID